MTTNTDPRPPRRRLNRIERVLLRFLQRRCEHPGDEVKADLASADARPLMVTWCASCGAVALNRADPDGSVEWREMRRPEPTWEATR